MLECKCCYQCEDRQPKCHSTCAEYKSFRKTKDIENARVASEKEREKRFADYLYGSIEKKKKRRRGSR